MVLPMCMMTLNGTLQQVLPKPDDGKCHISHSQCKLVKGLIREMVAGRPEGKSRASAAGEWRDMSTVIAC